MKVLITGGAGFIGSNVARYYLEEHAQVVVMDNLSRVGSWENVVALQNLAPPGQFIFERVNVIDRRHFHRALVIHQDASLIIHLAAQVAVTTSVLDPRYDLENNILGTFNLLESLRMLKSKALLIYSSTNKVYGADLGIIHESETRYHLARRSLAMMGIDESQQLDFHSPYGCSKGAAEQYVRDYSRIYGLNTTVFRQSCIYGPGQLGMEEQGWVAWFLIAAKRKLPVTVYGTGKQVRDLLYIDDLVLAYATADKMREKANGEIFNIGGGPSTAMSVNEVIAWIKHKYYPELEVRYADWRPGDQKVYITDYSKARERLGWVPIIEPSLGLDRLDQWIRDYAI